MSDEVESQSSSQIQRVTTEERAQALARLVSTQLALGNRRVESQTSVSAVLVRGKADKSPPPPTALLPHRRHLGAGLDRSDRLRGRAERDAGESTTTGNATVSDLGG